MYDSMDALEVLINRGGPIPNEKTGIRHNPRAVCFGTDRGGT